MSCGVRFHVAVLASQTQVSVCEWTVVQQSGGFCHVERLMSLRGHIWSQLLRNLAHIEGPLALHSQSTKIFVDNYEGLRITSLHHGKRLHPPPHRSRARTTPDPLAE